MNMSMMMNLFNVEAKVYEVLPKISPMGEAEVCTFISMLLEEWCKEKQINILEVSDNLHKVIKHVNDELGKY